MNIIDRIRMIERMDGLVRRRATGSPHELANKLNISVRSVYNLVEQMKQMGAPVKYCKQTGTYEYEEQVSFQFGFKNIDRERPRTYGGSKNNLLENNRMKILIPLQFSCSQIV